MKLFTIGFTKKTAEEFFTKLQEAGVERVLDVRLNNVSQLAGFSKRDDLSFFLRALHGIDYEHHKELAPTQELMDAFKKQKGPWSDFERDFLRLMSDRRVADLIPRSLLDHACLLCSEATPDRCHRSLVCGYLSNEWGELEVEHIL